MKKIHTLVLNLSMNHLVTLIVGLLLVACPYVATRLVVLAAGVLVAVNGIADLAAVIRERNPGNGTQAIISGIARLLLGGYMMLNERRVMTLVAAIFAIYLIVDGVIGLTNGSHSRISKVLHCALLLAGVVLLIRPIHTVNTAAQLLGLGLVADAAIGYLSGRENTIIKF